MTSLDRGPDEFFGGMARTTLSELELQEEVARREGKPFQEHETQRLMESMIQQLQERARMDDLEFAAHMETQQGVQELQAQEMQEQAQQVEQLNAEQLMEQIYMSGRRVPEPGEVSIEDQIAQASTRLPPDQVQQLQETYQQGRHNTEQLMRFESEILRIFSQEAGEQVGEEAPAGSRAGLPPNLILEMVRSGLDIGKGLVSGFTGEDFSRRGEILGQVRELIARTMADPEAFQGIAPEDVESMLRRSAERTLEGGFQRMAKGGTREFGEEVGHVFSWLAPMKLYAGAGKIAAHWLTVGLPKELAQKGIRAAALAERAGKAGKAGRAATLGRAGTQMKLASWFMDKIAMLPIAFGARVGLPLSDADMFWLEGQPEEEREALEWGIRVHKAAQWSAMIPFYGLAGTISGTASRAGMQTLGRFGVPERIAGGIGGTVGGYGTALLLPDAGAIGEQMLVKLAEGMDIPSFLKALQAEGQVQGPIVAIIGKIGQAPAEEVWDDILDYLGATATSGAGSAFMAMGFANGLGFRFRSANEAERRLKEARDNLRESGEEPEILAAIEKDLERTASEMAPSPKEEKARVSMEALERETGGREEARRALREAVETEEVPIPEGREARETTIEARREAIREETAAVREKRPTEETQRQLDAMRSEETAAGLRERARGKPEAEARQREAEAEALEEHARQIRAGKEPKAPTPKEVERASKEVVPAKRLAREAKREQQGPEIAERLVGEAAAKRKAKAAEKPIHEKTFEQYTGKPWAVSGIGPQAKALRAEHRKAVSAALEAGKEVPPKVMAEYPTEVLEHASQEALKGNVQRAAYLQGQLGKAQSQVAEARAKKPYAAPPKAKPQPAAKGKTKTVDTELDGTRYRVSHTEEGVDIHVLTKTGKLGKKLSPKGKRHYQVYLSSEKYFDPQLGYKGAGERAPKPATETVSGAKPDPGSTLPDNAISKRKSHKAYVQAELHKEKQDAVDAMDGVKPVDGLEGLPKEATEAWAALKDKDVSETEAPKRPSEGVFHPSREREAEARLLMMEKAAIDLLPHQEVVDGEVRSKAELQTLAEKATDPLHKLYYDSAAKLKGHVPDVDLDVEALYMTLKKFFPDAQTDTWPLMTKIQEMRTEFEIIKQKTLERNNSETWLRWGEQTPELSGPWSVAARYSLEGRRLVSDIDAFQQATIFPSLLQGKESGQIYIPGVTFPNRLIGAIVSFVRGHKISTTDAYAGTTMGDTKARAASRNAMKRKFGAWFGTAMGNWGQLGKEAMLAISDQYRLLAKLEDYYFGFNGLFRKHRALFGKESPLDPLDMNHADKHLTMLIESEGLAREKWPQEHKDYWDSLPESVKTDPALNAAAKDIKATLEPLRKLAAIHSGVAMHYKARAREAEEERQDAIETREGLQAVLERTEIGFGEFESQRTRIAEIKVDVKEAKKAEDFERVEELQEEARILGAEVFEGMGRVNAKLRAEAEARAEAEGKGARSSVWAGEKAVREEGLTMTPENVKKLIKQEDARIRAAEKRHKAMMDAYEDYVENFGYKNGFMHSITAQDHTKSEEIDINQLFDLIEQQPSNDVMGRMLIDIPDRRQARTMFKRTGKMGPERDLSTKRSIYHYIRDVAAAVHVNKFLFKWGPTLLGKIRRVKGGEILRPSGKGAAGDLFYDNGKYRGLGEVFEGTASVGEAKEPGRIFLRESEMTPEQKTAFAQAESARRSAAIGGVPSKVKGPRMRRRVLLYRGEDAASTKLNNPKWVAENLANGNLRSISRRTAFSRVRTRSPGLLRQLAAVTPAEHANFKSWFGRVMRESELLRGSIFDKDFEKVLNVSAKLVSAKVMGFYRVSSAIRAASAAAIYNGGTLGAHRAVMDLHLPMIYIGVLSRAKLTGDTFRDLMEWKPEAIEAGKAVTDPMEARLRKAIMDSDIVKSTGNSEHFADAAVAFYNSSLLQGHRGLAFFMKRYVRTGQKLSANPVAGAARMFIDKGWVPFDTGEKFVRAHMFLSSYMRYRAAGADKDYANQQALGATIALHGVFNKASKSAFMAHPAGQLLGSIMAWRHHWHGTFLRLPRKEKAKFLAYIHAVTMLGVGFGLSMEDILGVALKDMFGGLPALEEGARNIALLSQGYGIKTDEDQLGIQPKPFLEMLPGGEPAALKQAREELSRYIEELPVGNEELKKVLVRAQRLLMGDGSALQMGPVSPIDPLTVESPGTDFVLRLVDLAKSAAYGSGTEATTALEHLGQYLTPGVLTDWKRAFGTEESPEYEGHYGYQPPFSEKPTRYLESTGFEQLFRDLRPGRDLEEQLQFYDGQVERKIEEQKAKASQDLKAQGKEYLQQQELLRGLREERDLTPEEMEDFREQGRALRQRGRDIERPVTGADLNLWREEITQWESMDSRMRSVTRIRTKGQKIEALAKMLEKGQLTREQWATMMKVNKPRGETLGGWVSDLAPRIKNRFRAAYRKAQEAWR